MWELEERHLQEKHQQLKQQLKDQYFLQRHQLLKRHEKVSVAKRAVSSKQRDLAKHANPCARLGFGRRWSRCSATTSGWWRR